MPLRSCPLTHVELIEWPLKLHRLRLKKVLTFLEIKNVTFAFLSGSTRCLEHCLDVRICRNESVPIQLEQCWFPGLANSNAEIFIYLQIKYTEAILWNRTLKLFWFEVTKMLIADLLCYYAPHPGHFETARSIRLSVPWRSCLGYRHAGCLQLSHHRPPEMCGLRTRIDPPRFLPPSNCHVHMLSPTPCLLHIARDNDIIASRIYASWFSPPSCG